MIFITGDPHGRWDRFQTYKTKSTKDDTIIILGDFGLAWNPTTFQSGIRFFEKIPATVIAIKGNHENYDMIDGMPIVEKHGAKMHKCSDNVFYVCNGEMMTIEDTVFFAFGGGKSIDKDYRMTLEKKSRDNGRNVKLWWEQELPTDEEFAYGLEQFHTNAHLIDFILTHEAPTAVMRQVEFKDSYPQMRDFVKEIELYRTPCTIWLFGHLHFDKDFGNNNLGMYENTLVLSDEPIES